MLFGLSVMFAAGAVAIKVLTPPLSWHFPRSVDVPLRVALLAFSAVGAVIASRRPDNRIGWVFLAFGVSVSAQEFTGMYRDYVVVQRPGVLPGGVYAAWLSGVLLSFWLASMMFLFLLYPTGVPPLVVGGWWGGSWEAHRRMPLGSAMAGKAHTADSIAKAVAQLRELGSHVTRTFEQYIAGTGYIA
ncbi:MAG: hypothetical protein M3O70_20045 [Actinomycetota bacterium]|nr:hypothetical protein [Actinomycetota bacterium]